MNLKIHVRRKKKPGMVVCACNPSAGETELGRSLRLIASLGTGHGQLLWGPHVPMFLFCVRLMLHWLSRMGTVCQVALMALTSLSDGEIMCCLYYVDASIYIHSHTPPHTHVGTYTCTHM